MRRCSGRSADSASAPPGIGGLIALGIVMTIATKDVTDVVTPIMAVIKFINLMITMVQVVWGPLVHIGPFLALLALWAVGTRGRTPDGGTV